MVEQRRSRRRSIDSTESFRWAASGHWAITTMCRLPGCLEIYTEHETFMLKMPQADDADPTDPGAVLDRARTHRVGSTSPFIARTVIMAGEVLAQLHGGVEKPEELLLLMHAIKEGLLTCDGAASTYLDALAAEEQAFASSGGRLTPDAGALPHFPRVPDLQAKVTAFLIAARCVVAAVCEIPARVLKRVKRHGNLEHLLGIDLEPRLGCDHALVHFARARVAVARHIIDMRNGQEHDADPAARLNVRNFTAVPTNQLIRPAWMVGNQRPRDIAAEMRSIPQFLLDLAEGMFVGCVGLVLPDSPPVRFQLQAQPNPTCPVRYFLGVDSPPVGTGWGP